jgi:uncharacterized membrane protein
MFVHFTVALLSISAVFYLAGLLFKKNNFLVVARWNLWIGALATIGTVLAGWYAYNTVTHDGPSHAAMTDHRNWALVTASIFILLALWAFWKQRGATTVNPAFVVIILFAAGLLAITGYKGGEVVYRHGLGVMRMPMVSGDGGHGSHEHGGAGHGDQHEDSMPKPETDAHSGHDHGSHDH